MVLIENVAVLKSRGLDVVVDGLAGIGYGCWWDVLSALAVGAPHLRERIWVTAVPYKRMPELDGEPFDATRTKMPRAGASTARGLIEMNPCATQRMAKEAMGAVKREDGVTWLERIDTPLFPTPSSSSYGSNRGGAAGRVGPVRHSLESMARSGEWPEPVPCFPTPTVGDSRNSTANRAPGGNHHSGTTLSDHIRMWPTPHGLSHPDAPRAAGPSGNVLGNEVNREGRLWPTPVANDTNRSVEAYRAMRDGIGRPSTSSLSIAVREEQRLFPTPRSRDWKGGDLPPNGHHTTLDSLPAVTRMYPTPRKSDAERGGRGDLIQVVQGNKDDNSHGDQRMWPTAAADAARGPGRSEHRLGGANLRTAVADEKPGPISPAWVEWMLGVPIFWTDLACDEPVQLDWLSEYGIPRVLADVADRKSRLQSLGNSLVWRCAWLALAKAHVLLGLPESHARLEPNTDFISQQD